MKKHQSIHVFIFIVCLFYLLTPNVVFGSAQQVFDNYKALLLREDVKSSLPNALGIFRKAEIQAALSRSTIEVILNGPRFLKGVDSGFENQFIALLTIDDPLRELFRDERFYAVLTDPTEIDKLVALIVPIPTKLEKVSGEGQSGVSSTPLTEPFVVVVKDQHKLPITGIEVIFSVPNGGGNFSSKMNITEKTDNLGRAEATLTLEADPGVYSVVASVVDFPSLTQTFTAAATPAECEIPPVAPPKATTLSIVSGNNQSGESGMSLGQAFRVGVKDQSAKPLSGIRVTFGITAGRGQLSTQQVDTDSFGQAQTTLRSS
jgi:hypothetical protein